MGFGGPDWAGAARVGGGTGRAFALGPNRKEGFSFFQKLFSMQKYFQKSLENKLMARKILENFQ
jgi:hypothetical protein